MQESGFLYVLINPAMPGLAKVGKTTRNPNGRVAELSSATGVPTPFLLAYEQPVADCHGAEKWVHQQLESRGFRPASSREFFNAPLHEIVALVAQSASVAETQPGARTGSVGDAADECVAMADAYAEGKSGVLKDPSKALTLYLEAARLGSAQGAADAAGLLQYGASGVRKDPSRSLDLYRTAVRHGAWDCHGNIALLFAAAGQREDAINSWQQFYLDAYERRKSECQTGVSEPRSPSTAMKFLGVWMWLTKVSGAPDYLEYVDEEVDGYLVAPFCKQLVAGFSAIGQRSPSLTERCVEVTYKVQGIARRLGDGFADAGWS